jgi:sigma-B regulation protein RsbU (phosphoserine phosphatase)
METTLNATLQGQLTDRKHRLEEAIAASGQVDDLVRLLQQVDAALTRMDKGTYGTCIACHEEVNEEDLLANPLMQYCLCRLDDKQLGALQHDLDLARQIQSGLLPQQDFRSGGWTAHYHYEPAGIVSGDYCDILAARDNGGDLYFAMGDVSGKGVSAALLMAHLNASFRSLIQVGLPLTEIIARQNRMLLETNLPSHYATLVLGRAEASGRLEICNAGHCPPLVARRGGVEALAATGYPIGMVGDRSYTMLEQQLAPGDSLLLYTDGFVEAHNGGTEEFGQARLTEVLAKHRDAPPRGLADACIRELRGFLQGGATHDDLSLMVIRRER